MADAGRQTSALDTHTEQLLLQNINSILKEKARTSVFVAHRLRTIYDSDRIIVLQGGHVAESGTHAQLLLSGGLYSELWKGKLPSGLGACADRVWQRKRLSLATKKSSKEM